MVNGTSTISTAAEAAWLLGLTGIVIVAFSVPMLAGWVRPNHLWGVRTPTSMASARSWRVLNRVGGRVGTLWGVGMVGLAGIVRAAVPEGLNEIVYNLLVAVPAFGLVVHGAVAISRAGRPLDESPSPIRRWPNRRDQPEER